MPDARVDEMADEIRKHITKTHVQEWALEHYQKFIDEYISLARQSDFSYGYVWELKCRYLAELHQISRQRVQSEAKYVFRKEGDEWLIQFEGKPIRGLRGVGFGFLHYLCSNREKEIDVFTLGNLDGTSRILASYLIEHSDFMTEIRNDAETFDANEMADAETKAVYRREIESKIGEMKEAEKIGDMQAYEQAKNEFDLLKKQYDEDFFKGKARQFDDGTKKERVRIAKAIRRALDEIEGGKPLEQTPFRKLVAKHFREAFGNISLYKMKYNPKEKIDWILE